jgi:tRNA-uridine 2-sulfurtransferase
MLGRVDPAQLDRIVFPLGGQTKDQTRAEAERAGLLVARRAESQEACFLAGDDYRAFLGRRGVADAEGLVLDEHGTELGRHTGSWKFTPGQRRGLGVASTEPLYALRVDRTTNTVVVGPRAALARKSIAAAGRLYVPAARVEAKLRYRSPAVAAHVEERPDGFLLALDEPAYGIAPGQAAVLYEDDAVVGAGIIRD